MRCDLFVRNNQGMQPTTFAGRYASRLVIRRFSQAQTFAARYRRADGGIDRLRLALNTPPFSDNDVVRENTAALVQAQTGIETTMALATGAAGLAGLKSCEFDVLITVGAFAHPTGRPVSCILAVFAAKASLASEGKPSRGRLRPAYPVAAPNWFDESNDSIVSRYRAMGTDLTFVEMDLADVNRHFRAGGVIFTTGIPAMGHALLAVRPLGRTR